MTDIDEALAPVLPRELTEISDSVRRVSAPPTPILAEPYRLRLVDPDTPGGGVGVRPASGALAPLPMCPAGQATRARSSAAFAAGDVGYVELYRAAKDSIASR
jgi:hypothetical protein